MPCNGSALTAVLETGYRITLAWYHDLLFADIEAGGQLLQLVPVCSGSHRRRTKQFVTSPFLLWCYSQQPRRNSFPSWSVRLSEGRVRSSGRVVALCRPGKSTHAIGAGRVAVQHHWSQEACVGSSSVIMGTLQQHSPMGVFSLSSLTLHFRTERGETINNYFIRDTHLVHLFPCEHNLAPRCSHTT